MAVPMPQNLSNSEKILDEWQLSRQKLGWAAYSSVGRALACMPKAMSLIPSIDSHVKNTTLPYHDVQMSVSWFPGWDAKRCFAHLITD